MKEVVLNGKTLTREGVVAVASGGARIRIADEAAEAVRRAARVVEQKVARGEVVYGVTTGFGNNADKLLPDPEKARKLQHNLLLTHAVGVGDPLPEALVRAVMVIRINTLLQGHSGIRLETVETLVEMVNQGVHPWIPEKGSVGASGDLAPLSHMAMVLIGLGRAYYRGELMPGGEAMAAAGIEPATLAHKEGLALNNGTALMLAYGVMTLDRLGHALRLADVVAAMTMEALAARADAFREEIHALRHHPGQITTAANLRRLMTGSDLLDAPYEVIPLGMGGYRWNREMNRIEGGKAVKPQDSYSIRCVPQVHGAVRDAWAHVDAVMARELNAVTDNPIVLPAEEDGAGDVVSAGNFHGMPLALSLSYLKAAIPSLASISERRLNKLVDPATSDGLPPFLVKNADNTDSGFMIVQYTAAAVVNDLVTRAHPASVYSIPTSANQEDHVSMGATEGRHVWSMSKDLLRVLALEAYTSAQALETRVMTLNGEFWPSENWLEEVPEADRDRLRAHAEQVFARRHAPSPAIQAVLGKIRERVEIMLVDREMADDIAAMVEMVEAGVLTEAAESVAGPLSMTG